MTSFRSTKIVATIGPASQSYEMIAQLQKAGVNVFRLNFSHGSYEAHKAVYEAIRRVEDETGRPIAIMADLQGPKLRIGVFENGPIELQLGQNFRLDLEDKKGDQHRVTMPHPEIFEVLVKGAKLLLDDGKVQLEVLECNPKYAECKVLAGSKLSDRKGVNLPGLILPISPLTKKDREDLKFALDLGVDYIALSFVQKPEDVAEARKLIAGRAALILKLEKPSAIDYLDQLVDLSDAIMVARGDLGVELPPEDVPTIQKRIIHECRKVGRPVIVATQMLESMITAPTPTRAEASDVATAVYDGADAVMLSAETAAGSYPIEAVSFMDRITRKVEEDPDYIKMMRRKSFDIEESLSDAITSAARNIATKIKAAAIVTYTTSGFTARKASNTRPDIPVLCLTSNLMTARRLALSYGVYAVINDEADHFDEMSKIAADIAKKHKIGEKGQRLVITAGIPFGTPGNTNVLKVAWI